MEQCPLKQALRLNLVPCIGARGGVGLACRKRDAHDAAVTCEPPAYRVGVIIFLLLAVPSAYQGMMGSKHGSSVRLKPSFFRPPVNIPRKDGTRAKRRHSACGGRATSGIARTRHNIASAEASTSELCVRGASAPVTPSSGVRYQHT